MPCESHRLMIDAFHQTAVAGDDEGAVVDEIVAVDGVEVAFCDGHPDRHRHALTQRTRCSLDSGELEILRMTGAGGAELAKALDVVDRWPGVAGEVEQGIDQH